MDQLRDRYQTLIETVVQQTLKGRIRSKEQVYEMLREELEPGSDEVFEACLQRRMAETQAQTENRRDELVQAKAVRALRALKTLQGEWERFQQENQTRGAIATALYQITTAGSSDRLLALVNALDPNQPQPLKHEQLSQLAIGLRQALTDPANQAELQLISTGLLRGLEGCQSLQASLVGWIYERSQSIGFAKNNLRRVTPWDYWAKRLQKNLAKDLCRAIHEQEYLDDWVNHQGEIDLAAWVELIVIFQYLQQGLIFWADQQIYEQDLGTQMGISIYIGFATIWASLAIGLGHSNLMSLETKTSYEKSAFRLALQVMRQFAQCRYFPLYGSSFNLLSGDTFRDAMNYLSESLKQVEGTEEKARMLTLLGSNLRVRGLWVEAIEIYDAAREIAQSAGDRPCEIATWNHLSRVYAMQQDYAKSLNASQRALILSRTSGDRLGEANALTNFGYAEVLQAQANDAPPERFETAIDFLQQGLQLSETLADYMSEALCATSLGVAYLTLSQPETVLDYAQRGLSAAREAGDLYLQGLNLRALGEAYYQLEQPYPALLTTAIAMYQLERIGAREWRQAAGLLMILQGKLGSDFDRQLESARAEMLPLIGVEGYEFLSTLLDRYRTES
ncbi:MAG: tetratricopeptide repeat protein [Synechococcales bacterium]|nr:tetratricopeptide repeat protein [Synechococcales bacterium]